MKHIPKGRLIASILILVIGIGLLGTGIYGKVVQSSDSVEEKLSDMKAYAILRSSVVGIIDQSAKEAKIAARKFADENDYSRNKKAAYADEQEAIARAKAEEQYANFDVSNTDAVEAKIVTLEEAILAYATLEEKEKAAYAENYLAEYEAAQSEAEISADAESAAPAEAADGETTDEGAGEEVVEEVVEETVAVDYSKFKPSEELIALQAPIDTAYEGLWAEAMVVMPELTEDMAEDAKDAILQVVNSHDQDFGERYKLLSGLHADSVLSSGDKNMLKLASSSKQYVVIGAMLLLIGLVFLFLNSLKAKLGMSRLIISVFFVIMCMLALYFETNLQSMLSNVLIRLGMYGVLALSMLPGIQCGISLNMGMPIGCIAGLLSTMIALQMNLTKWTSLWFAIVVGILIAIVFGWLYGQLLNRMKGSEMTVATYVGFSFVSLMCIAWMLLPFTNPRIRWTLGKGLRVTHNLSRAYRNILEDFLSFKIFGITIPTGLLLFLAVCCLLMWLFSRSKTGSAMIAAGANPRFAEASGINVDKMRLLGTTISTVIASVGIIAYSSGMGYAQLYTAPKQMGFIAASAILIGGATTTRAKVSHVIIGTFLFQGVLAMGIQIANAAISVGGLSEVMRIMISNGIILYALTQSGGDSRA